MRLLKRAGKPVPALRPSAVVDVTVDPMTLRALDRLRQPNVAVRDHLNSVEVLAQTQANAGRVFVSKWLRFQPRVRLMHRRRNRTA